MTSSDETIIPSLNFNKDGLITAITQDFKTGKVLMLAWLNQDALDKTLETGEAHYWSRSRNELWHKGATSGAIQKVHEIRIDCDQDAVLLLVEQKNSGACHTGRETCFYRALEVDDKSGAKTLRFL